MGSGQLSQEGMMLRAKKQFRIDDLGHRRGDPNFT